MKNLRISYAWRAGLATVAAVLLVPAAAHAATADLSVTTVDSPDPVKVGQSLAYTLKVRNGGPENAAEATLTDKLSSHVDFVSATATQGSCKTKGHSVVCDLGGLAVSDDATVSIKVTPRKAGQAENTATIEVGKADTDPVSANDTDTEMTTVTAAGGGGQQKVSCAGRKATIVGTEGPDTLRGTAGRDVIKSGAGDDVIRGLSNKDLVCAGGGGDILRGGGDADLLKGGAGDDVLRGGLGDDALVGGLGDDTCRGGAGADTKKGC